MSKSPHPLSPIIVEAFCDLCDNAHECWLNHLALFDKNPRNIEFLNSFIGGEWYRLFVISHEYSLLQIRKLHDKAVTSGKITLGIDYILKYGGWSDSVRFRLERLAGELNGLANKLDDVRNKMLSHNDLATILAKATLGEFDEGADEKYFKDLQEFVDIVYEEVIGGPRPFNTLVKKDVASFLDAIKPRA